MALQGTGSPASLRPGGNQAGEEKEKSGACAGEANGGIKARAPPGAERGDERDRFVNQLGDDSKRKRGVR